MRRFFKIGCFVAVILGRRKEVPVTLLIHEVPTRRPPVLPARQTTHWAVAVRYDYYIAAIVMTALAGWAVYWLFDAFTAIFRIFLRAPWPFGGSWA